MKMISKWIIVLLLGVTSTAVFADSPAYIQAPKKSLVNSVFLVNQTRETYMAYSTYQGTARKFNFALGAYPHDIIEYPLTYPDYAVCMEVVQNYTNQLVYSGCPTTGTIYIHYLSAGNGSIVSTLR